MIVSIRAIEFDAFLSIFLWIFVFVSVLELLLKPTVILSVYCWINGWSGMYILA